MWSSTFLAIVKDRTRTASLKVLQQRSFTTLDGLTASRIWQREIAEQTAKVTKELGRPPCLSVVLIGDRPDSLLYVTRKQEACIKVGIKPLVRHLPTSTSQEQAEEVVAELQDQPDVDGVLVQLPLPKHLDDAAVIDTLHPSKDVDGLHPLNIGRLIMRDRSAYYIPCTAFGAMQLLQRHNIEVMGKSAVVLGDSNVVGLPLAMLLRDAGAAAVTLCHRTSLQALFEDKQRKERAEARAAAQACLPTLSGAAPAVASSVQTAAEDPAINSPMDLHSETSSSAPPPLAAITKKADILIVAVGRPGLVTRDWVKPGAVVVDIGINVVGGDGRGGPGQCVVGDVAFGDVAELTSAITPVPGGVGPMTISALLHNTLLAAVLRNNLPRSLVEPNKPESLQPSLSTQI